MVKGDSPVGDGQDCILKHDCLRCLKLGVTVQPQPALLGCGPPDCSLLGVSGVWMEETVKKRVHRRRRKGLLIPDGKKWPPVAAGPFRVPSWEKFGYWKVELMLVRHFGAAFPPKPPLCRHRLLLLHNDSCLLLPC